MSLDGYDRWKLRSDRDEFPDEEEYEDDYDDTCPTCRGRGTVNPLTAPADFFCVSTTDCPHCDGTGHF